MLKVYLKEPNEKPVWLADFDAEEFAQVLVDAGNALYQGECEFYFEDSQAAEVDDDIDENPDDGYCASCSGTGEGSHDGARCMSCKGKGVLAWK